MKSSGEESQNASSLLGKRLRDRRKLLELSQEAVGVSIGLYESCSRTRISRYESGIHEPKIATVWLLSKALNAPVAYFYAEKDEVAELILKISQMSDEEIEYIKTMIDFINEK
jgi:transcriptional regulator with XRE-family HTH domain